jgi:hypothetical protein
VSVELFEGELPAMIASDDESVEMGVEAVVEAGERLQIMMWEADCGGPQVPEECSLLGVLGQYEWDRGHCFSLLRDQVA